MINKVAKNNNETLERDCKGNFYNPFKDEELRAKQTRPLSDKENEMIRKFIEERNKQND